MGALNDIIDVVKDIDDNMGDDILKPKRKMRSLSRESMEGTLNFPVIVSNALTIEDATLISKALERQFSSFVLTVMTMNPYLYTSKNNPSAEEYLRKFHQNLDMKPNANDISNLFVKFLQESYDINVEYSVFEDSSKLIAYKLYEDVKHRGLESQNIKYNYTIEEVTEASILNEADSTSGGKKTGKGNKNSGGYNKSKPTNTIGNSTDSFNTIYMPMTDDDSIKNSHNMFSNNKDSNNTTSNSNNNSNNKNSTVISGDGNSTNTTYNYNYGTTSQSGQANSNRYARQLTHMMDNEFKKANELVPTLLHMRIYPVDKTSNVELAPIDVVIGIKATLHPVPSEDMIVNVARGIKNESKLFNFLRWTTGEITFFKDFLFNVNELKLDAINKSSRSTRWWTMMKRRKAIAKIKNKFPVDNLLPNSTIVMTQEEVETLKTSYGYDIEKGNLAYKLIENYFLIALVIVDPALQRVKFLFDGKNEFETLTYATLARENNVDDKKFKDMVNMLGRRM